jgi:hypothetical protein
MTGIYFQHTLRAHTPVVEARTRKGQGSYCLLPSAYCLLPDWSHYQAGATLRVYQQKEGRAICLHLSGAHGLSNIMLEVSPEI